MSLKPLLLIVEDDDLLRERLARALTDRGCDVRQAASVEAALASAREETPELVLLDLRMPGGSGLDLIPELKRLDAATRIVVLTGYGSIATALEAVRLGAVHYLTKPADADEILAAFERGSEGGGGPVRELRPMSLDRVEWEHINRVLMDCGGNISEAARVLGLHRRSLQRKLARYPLPR
ncbi:MAG: response regulator [Vicinamibacterales bacterium]